MGALLLQFPYFNKQAFAGFDAFGERLGVPLPALDALPGAQGELF